MTRKRKRLRNRSGTVSQVSNNTRSVPKLWCADVMQIPQRRIDDRLSKLCVRALTAPDRELEGIPQELLALVDQKIQRLKRRAARLLLKGDHLEPERRSTEVVDFLPKSNGKAA